jgi:hypothetical protein
MLGRYMSLHVSLQSCEAAILTIRAVAYITEGAGGVVRVEQPLASPTVPITILSLQSNMRSLSDWERCAWSSCRDVLCHRLAAVGGFRGKGLKATYWHFGELQ